MRGHHAHTWSGNGGQARDEQANQHQRIVQARCDGALQGVVQHIPFYPRHDPEVFHRCPSPPDDLTRISGPAGVLRDPVFRSLPE